MKIKCDVCKTEYTLGQDTKGRVRCAVCGNVWNCDCAPRRNVLLMFFASVCALLAATIFAVAVIVTSRNASPNKKPLVAKITEITSQVDDSGTKQLIVDGIIKNRSTDVYGLPDLIVVLHDADGNPIAKQRFMPPATLIDSGQTIGFSHTLSGAISDIKKVTIELEDSDRGVRK